MSRLLCLLKAVGVENVNKLLHGRQGRLQTNDSGHWEEDLNEELAHGTLHAVPRTVNEPIGQLLRTQDNINVINTYERFILPPLSTLHIPHLPYQFTLPLSLHSLPFQPHFPLLSLLLHFSPPHSRPFYSTSSSTLSPLHSLSPPPSHPFHSPSLFTVPPLYPPSSFHSPSSFPSTRHISIHCPPPVERQTTPPAPPRETS